MNKISLGVTYAAILQAVNDERILSYFDSIENLSNSTAKKICSEVIHESEKEIEIRVTFDWSTINVTSNEVIYDIISTVKYVKQTQAYYVESLKIDVSTD